MEVDAGGLAGLFLESAEEEEFLKIAVTKMIRAGAIIRTSDTNQQASVLVVVMLI